MAGLLIELRRQIYKKHRKGTYSSTERGSQPSVVSAWDSYHEPDCAGAEAPVEPDSDVGTADMDIADSVSAAADGGSAVRADESCGQVENICERTQSVVNKDDILLKQIDEFKERAKQLQTMLDTRESKAEELQSLVDERQEKADALGQILEERQQKADGFTLEVEKQIDSLIAKVGIKMDEIESSVREDLGENSRFNKERAEEMKESLAQIQEQLQQAKSELSEKVHSENVKCYRNIQDLFRSMDEKLDRLEPLEQRIHSTRTCVMTAMIFTIVNFVGILVILLLNLGVFTF